jgi:chitinase
MRQKIFFIILLLSFLVFPIKAQYSKSDFRVVGYYYLRDLMARPNKIPFKLSRLTHVNLAFLAPDSLGNFTQDLSSLKHFIKMAHKNNVKVLFSIGGGDSNPNYSTLLLDDKRPVLVKNFLSLVLKYNLDGIDVDIENSDLDNNYEAFVVEMASALRLHQKLITAALQFIPESVNRYTDKALEQFDFINIMSYDHMSGKRPAPHSSYSNSAADIDIYAIGRKIPKEKLTLGVPFYGYLYGPDITGRPYRPSINYRDIVSEFPGAESTDSLKNMSGGKSVFYNGIPTIKQKTTLAKEKASGIMIWQLGGDAHGSKSLLKAIYETAYKMK